MLHKIRSFFTLDTMLPLLAVAIALSWAWNSVGAMQDNFQFQRKVDELRQHNAVMEIENKSLEYRIAYYKTKEFAELSARENLNKAAPGEKVLVVPPSAYESDSVSSLAIMPTKPAPARSNFQQWMFFLFRQHRAES